MPAAMVRTYRASLHPLQTALLAGAIALFLGAFLSDFAYVSSYEVQWKNFSSWLIVGGLVFSGFALLWALIDLFRPSGRGSRHILYFGLVFGAWVIGLINALYHAMDAWEGMPAGFILSAAVVALTIAALTVGSFVDDKEVLR